MENKTFELLTKMYDEFSDRFDSIGNRLDGVEKRLSKVELIIENEIKNDIRALYDGYRQANEGLKVIKETVDEISAKIDRHEVEIRVIKGGKS